MQMNRWNLLKMMDVLMLLVVSFTSNAQTSNSFPYQWKDAEHHEEQIEVTNLTVKYVGKTINSSNPVENGKSFLEDLVWIDASKSYKGNLINHDNVEVLNVKIKMPGTHGFRFSAGKLIFSRTFTFNIIAP